MIRYVLSLAVLIIPTLMTLTLLKNKSFNPLVSLSYLVAIGAAGWLFGLGPGLLTVAASIVSLTFIATGGKLFFPAHLDIAATLALIFVALLSSRVAAYRKRVEDVLRSANEVLEQRVRERTADLDRARESLQITIASIGDAVIATDTAGNVALMNGVAESLTGWPLQGAAGRPLAEIFRIVNEDTRAPVPNPVDKVLELGTVVGLANHTILIARDGRETPIDDSAAPIRAADGSLAGVVLIFRDITERRRAEHEREDLLRQTASARADAEYQRAHLESILFQAPVAIDILGGPRHVYEFVHPLTRDRLGRDVTALAFCDAHDRSRERNLVRILDEVYSTGLAYHGKAVPLPHTAGSAPEQRFFDLTFTPWRERGSTEVAGIITLAADVTEQVENRKIMQATEDRLRETAKLESLGVLAGGIAHDFNNLLVGILGNASLAQEMIPVADPVQELLTDLVGAGEKAALLTRQMLAYSGKGKFVVEPVSVSQMVREILPLVSRSTSPLISFDVRLAADIPVIEADKTQIQQVVMNLLINGAEACGVQPGMVHVSTSACHADSRSLPPAYGIPPVHPGTFVCLEVRDTGCGMTEEIRTKIFDPFFTTKFTGRGLGLSAVLGIIRAHRGGIQVESAPGKGTSFRIYFPAAVGAPEAAGTQAFQDATYGGGGTILVVDDEEVVRKTARIALERCGYRVLTAENGENAVQTFRRLSGEVLLVIMDLTMPVMGGEAAFEHLKRIDPSVKVLLSSGFSVVEAAERFKDRGLAGFLQKPYTLNTLIEQVRTAMAQAPSTSPPRLPSKDAAAS